MAAPADFITELRQSCRLLRLAPGFAAVSILSLALGIGATTTVFSVIYGVLLNPYPYAAANRMVQIRLLGQSGRRNFLLLSSHQFTEFEKLDILDGSVVEDTWDMASTGDALPESVRTVHFSPGAFSYFGVPPLLGRTFTAGNGGLDQQPEHVAVLSYLFWQHRYSANKDVIGKVLQLDHRDYEIIGVMPPQFRWRNGAVYTPLQVTPDPNRIYMVDARLKPGVRPERAEAAMQPLLETFAKETPQHFPPQFQTRIRSLADSTIGNFRGTLFLLFGAVGVLLAVGCANVSILFLARGTGRLHEFAVRAALGASRKRLIYQLLTETASLALFGGAAGVLLAAAGVRTVLNWLPKQTFQPETVIQLNGAVLLFSTAVAIVTGVFFGAAPALRFSTPQLGEWMRDASNRATPGCRSRGAHRLLVSSQVALTVLLLALAGSAVRTFLARYHTKLGYDAHHVLTAGISLSDGSYTRYEARAAFYRAIHLRLAGLPGIQSAALTQFPIPPAEPIRQTIRIMGRARETGQTVDIQETTADYFSTLRIPLLRGRAWSDSETDRAAQVAVINEEMARHFWPNRDPLGQKIELPEFKAFTAWILAANGSTGWLEVIGVVGNTPNRGLAEPAAAAVYVPFTLLMGDSMEIVVRTTSTPMSMVRALREQIHAVDPGQPVSHTETAEDLLRSEGWAREEFIASLFLVFAIVALALAVTGLYSVVSYATALRSHEFGIRLALGGQTSHLVRLVLYSALKPVAVGVLAGLALSFACNNLIEHWVSSTAEDPVMLCMIALVLFLASGAAAWNPARRAAGAEPMRVLRGV